MEDDDRRMTCSRCRKSVLIADIRYLPTGDNERLALCSECRTKTGQVEKKKGSASYLLKNEVGQKAVYFCGRCRYKFKHEIVTNAKLRCPYCGKDDQLMQY